MFGIDIGLIDSLVMLRFIRIGIVSGLLLSVLYMLIYLLCFVVLCIVMLIRCSMVGCRLLDSVVRLVW